MAPMTTPSFHAYDEEGYLLDTRLGETLPALGAVSEPYRISTAAPATASQNVLAKWKGFTTEAVRLDQDTIRSKQIHVFVNTGSDYNVSTAIRSANAFMVGGVVLTNRKRYDKRGAVGQDKYNHVVYVEDTLAALSALRKEGYHLYSVDCIPEENPTSVYEVAFPEKSAFVYGEEGAGLSPEVIAACDEMVWIPMPGGVRSLNLSVSASLMMAEYCRHWPLSRLFE